MNDITDKSLAYRADHAKADAELAKRRAKRAEGQRDHYKRAAHSLVRRATRAEEERDYWQGATRELARRNTQLYEALCDVTETLDNANCVEVDSPALRAVLEKCYDVLDANKTFARKASGAECPVHGLPLGRSRQSPPGLRHAAGGTGGGAIDRSDGDGK